MPAAVVKEESSDGDDDSEDESEDEDELEESDTVVGSTQEQEAASELAADSVAEHIEKIEAEV